MVEARREFPASEAVHALLLLPTVVDTQLVPVGRFYVMGENVLTFSKFKLWDPEINSDNGIKYPNVRTFSVGVNFNF